LPLTLAVAIDTSGSMSTSSTMFATPSNICCVGRNRRTRCFYFSSTTRWTWSWRPPRHPIADCEMPGEASRRWRDRALRRDRRGVRNGATWKAPEEGPARRDRRQ
jgi:hypothetical protein